MPEQEHDILEERIATGPKHWLSGWLGALTAFLIPLVVIAYFLGVFNRPTITVTDTGPYRYVYLPFQGPYYQVDDQLQQLQKLLFSSKIPHGEPLGIFYDDPRKVPEQARHARAGYLIAAGVQVPAGVQVATIPRRRVVKVDIQAHPAIAPIKGYRALNQWMSANGRSIHWPTVEFYGPQRTVSIETPLQ